MDEAKMDELLDTLNEMFKLCEPVVYKDFNKVIKALDVEKLRAYEKEHPKVGMARYGTPEEGISIMSIIATITDILVGKRLAFIVENKDPQFIKGQITGVTWFEKNPKETSDA